MMHSYPVRSRDGPLSCQPRGVLKRSRLEVCLALPSSTQEPAFLVNRFGRVVEINLAAARLLGEDRARVGALCHEMLAGRETDGTPICRADCEYLRSDPSDTLPSPRDVTMTGPRPEGRDGSVDRELSLRHIPMDKHGQRSVLHLLDDATTRRRRERIGARLEGLQSGAPMPSCLTARELDVLGLVAEGLSATSIATRLGIRPSTARNHVSRILGKLGAANRPAALTLFLVGAPVDGKVPPAGRRTRRRPARGQSR